MPSRRMLVVVLGSAAVVLGGCSGTPPEVKPPMTDPSPSVTAFGRPSATPPGYEQTVIASGISRCSEWHMNADGHVVAATDWPEDVDSIVWDPHRGVSRLGTYLEPVAINAAGQVAGLDWDPDVVWDSEPAPFLWDPESGLQDVGMRPTEESSFWVTGLTESGHLMGTASFGDVLDEEEGTRRHTQAALWDARHGLVTFGRDGTEAVDVNAAGEVLVIRTRPNKAGDGWVRSTFVWKPGDATQHVVTSEDWVGEAINDQGQVLISAIDEQSEAEYQLWDPGTGRATPVPPERSWGGPASTARGQVALLGSDGSARVWDPAIGLTRIENPPGVSEFQPLGINNDGRVVGYGQVAGGRRHAFLWDPVNGLQDIGRQLATDSAAVAISDRGAVLAWSAPGLDPDEPCDLLIWTPIAGRG